MNEERQAKIREALQDYRETVSRHSLHLLRILVDAIEARPVPPEWSKSVDRWRLKRLTDPNVGRFSLPTSVTQVSDILRHDIRDEVISRNSLDGVVTSPFDQQVRAEYFAAAKARITELNVVVAEFPPRDLEYLCKLVNGIIPASVASPLNKWDFVSPIQINGLEVHGARTIKNDVIVPIRDDEGERQDELQFVWEDWDIAVAWRIGTCDELGWGGSLALFCRQQDEKEWAWRYGMFDEDWTSDIYDSVEDFMRWYAIHYAETEEDVRRRA